MIEVLINIFISIALLICSNSAPTKLSVTMTWLSGINMGIAISLIVNLYLS
jgi:hypothetical protein